MRNTTRQIVFSFVGITPAPGFAWFDGSHYWMSGGVKVLCRVPVLRGIATPHMAARQAKPQVHPAVARLDAIFTNVFGRVKILRFFDVFAVCHAC